MPQEWREVLERRNRTSKTRRLYEDGQPTRKYSWDGQVGASMHYPDAGGAWQDVDVNAEDPDTDGFTLKFTKLSYFGRVDGEGRRRFYPDRNDLAYWIEFKKPYANMGTPTRHNRWFYWDFAHATIGVRFDVDSLKFGFRLKDAQAPTSITIPFETQGITRQGRLLYHNGEVVAELRKPIATGSNLDAEGMLVQKECDIVFGPGEVTISLDPTGLEYPIEIDPTVDKQVGANEDDGRVLVDYLFQNFAVSVGESGSYLIHSWLRWTGITIEGTIDVSYVEIYYLSTAGTPLMKFYGVDEDNPAAPTDVTEFAADPLTTASVDWDTSWSGTWNQSPSLNTIFQELVDSYTINNDAVMLQLKDDGSGPAENYNGGKDYNDDSALTAKLHIEYMVGETKTLAGVSTGVAGVSGLAVGTFILAGQSAGIGGGAGVLSRLRDLAGISAGVASVFGTLYEEVIQALGLVAVKRSFAPEAETRKLALDAEKREFDLTAVHRDRP